MPNPITPPAKMLPAAIVSVFEAMIPVPSWKHSFLQTTVIELWLLSRTSVAGVVTTLVPIAGEFKVHCAPGTPGVVRTMGCVVPLVIVAHAVTKKANTKKTLILGTHPPWTSYLWFNC